METLDMVKDLRDEMAMAALQGILSSPYYNKNSDIEATAATSYRIADGMLAARKVK